MKHLLLAMIFTVTFGSPAFADATAGEALFKKCKGCHSFTKKKMGPNLTGISKRANPEWLKKWLTGKNNKEMWAGNDPITADLKKRTGKKKSKHKNALKKPEDIANMVDFLMTK